MLSRLGRFVRASLSFVGLMAVGLIIGVVITAIGSGFSGAAGARRILDINSFAAGLATGFVARPTEHGPSQSKDLAATGSWDVVAADFTDLAARMAC